MVKLDPVKTRGILDAPYAGRFAKDLVLALSRSGFDGEIYKIEANEDYDTVTIIIDRDHISFEVKVSINSFL